MLLWIPTLCRRCVEVDVDNDACCGFAVPPPQLSRRRYTAAPTMSFGATIAAIGDCCCRVDEAAIALANLQLLLHVRWTRFDRLETLEGTKKLESRLKRVWMDAWLLHSMTYISNCKYFTMRLRIPFLFLLSHFGIPLS
jgi:hypothetical protein